MCLPAGDGRRNFNEAAGRTVAQYRESRQRYLASSHMSCFVTISTSV